MHTSSNNRDGGFFQSEAWGKFQAHCGRHIWKRDAFPLTVLSLESPIVGSYGYLPRGPIIEMSEVSRFIEYLQEKQKAKKISFLRMEPQTPELLATLKKHFPGPVRKAPYDLQPREVLFMDISPSEEVLREGMKSKTRYNIRLAEKKGVVIRQTRDPQEVEIFLKIMQETALRKDVRFHPKDYFQSFLDFFPPEICTLFVAEYDGSILAGSLVAFYESTAYYLHGGSRDAGRNVMAPHLLQWEQIKEAKRRGCTQYDFGGVSIETAPKHKDWSGITRFKRGFAPHTDTMLFPGTYDFVFHKFRYSLYSFIQKIRM